MIAIDTETSRIDRWIDAIASDPRTDTLGVLQHIQKHCGQELVDEYTNDRLTEWIASLENLTQILYKLQGYPSNELRIQRLQEQVDKYPNTRTPEPI